MPSPGEHKTVQVIYLLDPDDTVFVLHARPLTEREKKQLRKRWKT
jgi:hypothetical protein